MGDKVRDPRAGFAITASGIAALTVALAPFRSEVGVVNEGLLLLLLTLVAAAGWGRAVGFFAAVTSFLVLNFFFVEPLHQLQVADARNGVALAVFLGVSVVGSSLLSAARASAKEAIRGQAQTEVLLKLSRAMIGQVDPESALTALCVQVLEAFEAPGAAVLSPSGGKWEVVASAGGDDASREVSPEERALAEEAVQRRSIEGAGRTGLSRGRLARIVSRQRAGAARATSVIVAPLLIGEAALGVLRLDGPARNRAFGEGTEDLLRAFASEAALSVQRLELARAAARTQALQEASEAKTSLMMSISHDLKTPLATIKTSVSSLLDQSVSWPAEDVQAFLETIDSQVDYLNRAISDILDLNRLESGAVRPLLKEARARDILEDAAERCAILTSGRNVTIDASPELRLVVDQSLAVQALVNLIDNAAKYSRPGGDIRLRASGDADAVELIVEDDGPGIAPADLARVFDRFYRLSRNMGETKGSGLGLALVKAFATLSGGTAEAESTPQASIFKLRFPAASPQRSSA